MSKKIVPDTNNPIDKSSKRLAEIDATYALSQEYDFLRIANEGRFHFSNAAEHFLHGGRCAILIKEHEPHGRFIEGLKIMGLAERAAQKAMQATYKFAGDRAALTSLGKTKMLELLTEDDEKLSVLSKGGTLAGHTMDEYDRMTKSEMRIALRKSREQEKQSTETHEKILAKKDKKINQLDKKLMKSQPWPDRVEDINAEIAKAATKLIAGCEQLQQLREVIFAEEFEAHESEEALNNMCVRYFKEVESASEHVAMLIKDCNDNVSGYTDRQIQDLV